MANFKTQQEKLWKTVDKLKDEYRKYLKTLSKEQLEDEILEMATDRYYAAFTTDLVMNVFLEEGLLDEKEANALPTDYFKAQIEELKLKRSKGKITKKATKKTVKKTVKKTTKKTAKKAVKAVKKTTKVAKKAVKKKR